MKVVATAALVLNGPALAQPPAEPTVTVGGYLEAQYQVHFQDPTNRLTNLRAYDNRSRTFTISNVALDVKASTGPVTTRIILQIGHTPSAYYAAEPTSAGASGVNPSSGELWKYVQTATLAYAAPRDVNVEAGLFLSPIGPEVIAIKDNMNWSRSNLFFALPAYHTGARASKPLGGAWTGTFAVYNGWSSVVDNNGYPSIAVSATYATEQTTGQLLYFGGIERPGGAPEGKPWRHLVDALVQHAVTGDLTFAAQLDAGIERNELGTSAWVAGAGYAKLALSDELYAGARADYFYERIAVDDGTTASAMFWPTKWIASGTATLAYQPATGVSVRLEARHDQADSDVFFGGDVATDAMTMAFVPDRDSQDTVTLGVTAWF